LLRKSAFFLPLWQILCRVVHLECTWLNSVIIFRDFWCFQDALFPKSMNALLLKMHCFKYFKNCRYKCAFWMYWFQSASLKRFLWNCFQEALPKSTSWQQFPIKCISPINRSNRIPSVQNLWTFLPSHHFLTRSVSKKKKKS
jgi:hypothetical protein